MLQPEKTFSSIRNRKSVKMTEVISSCININLHDKKKNEGTEFDKLKSDEINCFALMNEEVNDTQLKFVENKLPTQTLRGYLEEPLERNSFKYDNRLFNTMKQNPKYVALWLVFWPLFDFVLVILLLFFYVPFLTFLGAFGIKTDFLTHSMGIIGLLCSLIVQTLYWHHQLLEMVVEYTKGSSKFLSNMKERLDNRFDWKTATHGSVRTIMDTVAKAILDQKQNPVAKQNKTPEAPNVNVKNEEIMKMAPFNVNLKAKYPQIDTDTKTTQIRREFLDYSSLTTLWLLFWPLADIVIVLLLMVFTTPFIMLLKNLSEKIHFLLHSTVMVTLFCSLFIQTLFWHHQMLEMAIDCSDRATTEMKDMNQRFKNRIYVKTATHT